MKYRRPTLDTIFYKVTSGHAGPVVRAVRPSSVQMLSPDKWSAEFHLGYDSVVISDVTPPTSAGLYTEDMLDNAGALSKQQREDVRRLVRLLNEEPGAAPSQAKPSEPPEQAEPSMQGEPPTQGESPEPAKPPTQAEPPEPVKPAPRRPPGKPKP